MADFDSRLPVRALATDVTVEVANSTGTTINPVEEFAQGSTTSGQKGNLAQGATTTAAPTYTTGQTNPLSLTTTGALRTDGSGTTQPVSGTVSATQGTSPWVDNLTQVGGSSISLGQQTSANSLPVVIASDQSPVPVSISSDTEQESPQYNTASSIAANASSTQSYTPGSTVMFDGVDASASGQMKVEIQYGNTGSETTKVVFFTSKGNLLGSWRLPHPISITTAMTIKVIRTNTDNQAMDVYSTILVH